MHLTKLTLALLPLALTSVSASTTPNDLLKRGPTPLKSLQTSALLLTRSPQDNDNEVCASDQKRCGNACVNEDFDCCPQDVSGGCPSDETCMEDNGVWGCCDDGDNCSWDDEDDNNDDDDGFLDEIQDGVSELGDDIEDGVDDIFDDDDDDDEDAAGMLKPGVGVALLAALSAVVLDM
ncbi:hypothetical protein BDV19DRAFT_358202 [Aspergillus venezuelensis]